MADPTMADEGDLVLTPGGLRPRSLVHTVEAGQVIDGRDRHLRVQEPAGEVVADVGHVPLRPKGVPLMPRNVTVPAPAEGVVPAFGSGWITYASWSNDTGSPVSRFATTWVVPPEPTTHSGQTIFLFNGIQNSTMIYQPVLQWGSSAAGGGEYWSVASWYADGQGGAAFKTGLTQVNPGDVLTGVMTKTGSGPAGFSYDCEFTGIANTSLPIQNIEQLTWCIETLEAYGVTQCSDYPNTTKTAMASIDLETDAGAPTLLWTVSNPVTECGQHTLIFNEAVTGAGEVDLWYRSSPFWTFGNGTLAPGESQDWWFSWGGVGDVGPQLIQAEPLVPSGELATTAIAEELDANGHLTYHATVTNHGSTPAQFQWRGGGR